MKAPSGRVTAIATKPEIHVGLVGAGGIGCIHAQAFGRVRKLFDLPAEPILDILADIDEDLAQRRAEQLGFARWTTDWRELVSDPRVDLVDITTPNHLHAEPAIAAARAGKHVYCEKPLAETEASARRMKEAAREFGVKSFVGFNSTKYPATLLAKRLIGEGQIGTITRFRGTFDQGFYAGPTLPHSWRLERSRAGPGAIGDLGSHVLAIALFLVDDIVDVCASTQIVHVERPIPDGDAPGRTQMADDGRAMRMGIVDNDDQAQSLVTFASGVSGVIESSRVAPGRIGYLTWEITGTEGTLAFNGERMNELHLYRSASAPESQGFRIIQAGPGIPQWHGFFDLGGGGLGYWDLKVIEVHDIIAGITGASDCFPDFEFGWKVSAVIDAMLLSAEERRWVLVEEIGPPVT